MGMTTGGNGGPVGEMNVTPLIDVLLVLIIVFMIVSSAQKSSGLEALIPHPPVHENVPPPAETIVVQLLDSGGARPNLRINQDPVTWEALRERLRRIYDTRAERVMFVKADPVVEFLNVALVIDTARADFSDMRIGLVPGGR